MSRPPPGTAIGAARDLRQTVQINLNFAVWYYTAVHGGDAIQDWRYRDAGLPVSVALWLRGAFEGPDVLPALAIAIAESPDEAEALWAQCLRWSEEGTPCWLVNLTERAVASTEAPDAVCSAGEFLTTVVSGFRIDCAAIFFPDR